MGVKFGEIDASQILENEFRINVLEAILDRLIQRNPLAFHISPQEIEQIRQNVVTKLQRKYPNSGIGLKQGPQ
jgi:hypothetical protein